MNGPSAARECGGRFLKGKAEVGNEAVDVEGKKSTARRGFDSPVSHCFPFWGVRSLRSLRALTDCLLFRRLEACTPLGKLL